MKYRCLLTTISNSVSSTISKFSEIVKNARFSIGRTLDCVIQIKRVIPIFHTEFDALKVLPEGFGEIPPSGDFGDLLWLLTSK